MTPLSALAIDHADDIVVARLKGEIDLSNARDLGADLASAVPNTALGLVIDLTAVEYLDSSGIHMIFELAERLGRRQQASRVVVPEGAPIRRVLRIVELQGVVPIVATVGEAVAEIRRDIAAG